MIRLFAHRGFTAQLHPQNSVASLKEAVAHNFKAIEFDLWFLSRRLLLKHDHPQEREIEILPELSDYLTYKNDLDYWFDFKNLDEENCVKALMLAKSEIEDKEINLDHIYFAPFITDYVLAEKIFLRIRNVFGQKAKIIAVCSELKNEDEAKKLRVFLDKNNVKCLSIFHELLGKNSLAILAGIEIFAWTVNDLKRLQELEILGVTNFATDNITPQIYEAATAAQPSRSS